MIYDMIMDELHSRDVYKADIYAPFYICSFATHVFNLMNQEKKIYWESKRLPNMRTHLLFVAPPGFMKSFYLQTMAANTYGIFRNAGIDIGNEQYLCLPKGEKVNMADGSMIDISEISTGDMVMAFSEDSCTIVPTVVTNTHSMIADKIVRLVLRDGRTIRMTPNHPVYNINGWIEAGNVSTGMKIAVPSKYDIDGESGHNDIAFVLGCMLADGNFRQMTFACVNEYVLEEFTNAVEKLGCTVKQTSHVPEIEYLIKGNGSGNVHPFREELKTLGIDRYCVRDEKFIPNEVFTWDDNSVASLIRGLFSGDGHHSGRDIIFANLSENLVRGSQQLLLRFGIQSKIGYDKCNGIWKLYITSYNDVSMYDEYIGFSYPTRVVNEKKSISTMGSLPGDVWDIIDEEKGSYTWAELGKMTGRNITQAKYKRNAIQKSIVIEIATIVGSDVLMRLASDDINWMEVISVEVQPGEMVYNISTDESTFVAQNIVTHNTEAGFVGTIQSNQGVVQNTEGAAKTYDKGLLLIDEFSAITKALQTQHSNQLDSQMLSALDHGHVMKRLGSGKIEYDTYLTLWAGVQPAKFDLTSGMGRRLIYMVFIPSQYDNQMLMETMHRTRNVKPNEMEMRGKWHQIKKFKDDMSIIKRIEFDDSVLKMYSELNLFSFEGSYFDRILLGYHLAKYGPDETMTISFSGEPELQQMVRKQKQWRGEISMGIEFVQLSRILELNGGAMTRSELVAEAAMYGWNGAQITDMVEDMKKSKLLDVDYKSKLITLV